MTSPTKPEGYPDNNPKTAVGVSKAPLHFIPPVSLVHLGLAMEDGGHKYGLMNWREFTVSSSVYYDAIFRHLLAWWDGEDAAPDSGVHHLGHVMACCAIILDAEASTRLNDDRPKIEGFVADLLVRIARARKAKLLEPKPDPWSPEGGVVGAKIVGQDFPTWKEIDLKTDVIGPHPTEAGLRELAAREAGATPNELFGAPTPKPPEDANNDDLKHHSRMNLPKPGTPLMRRGLRVKGNSLWFEDTVIVPDLDRALIPSDVARFIELVDAIDGEPHPARWSEVNSPEG